MHQTQPNKQLHLGILVMSGAAAPLRSNHFIPAGWVEGAALSAGTTQPTSLSHQAEPFPELPS